VIGKPPKSQADRPYQCGLAMAESIGTPMPEAMSVCERRSQTKRRS
jgi:hypothetical protein